MNDEQKAQLEEIHLMEKDSIQKLIETESAEVLFEKIRSYSILIEMMARALVNKTKE